MSEIQLRLPDGQVKKYASGITGQEVAEKIGSRLAKDALAIKIDGQLLDLNIPVEQNAAIEIMTFRRFGRPRCVLAQYFAPHGAGGQTALPAGKARHRSCD